MTKISEAAKRKVCELLNDAARECGSSPDWEPRDIPGSMTLEVLARVLQEHSDAAKRANRLVYPETHRHLLKPLILPDDPDPLDGLFERFFPNDRKLYERGGKPSLAFSFRTELAARGLKIVEAGND